MDIERSGRKLRQILEHILEGKLEVRGEPDAVEKLRTLYGQKLYRCRRQSCAVSYAKGFETSAQRDQHEDGHDILYKCSEENCFYKDVGFSSKAKLQRHSRGHHNTAFVSRPKVKALEVFLRNFLHMNLLVQLLICNGRNWILQSSVKLIGRNRNRPQNRMKTKIMNFSAILPRFHPTREIL